MFVRLLGTIMVMCQCGTVELLLVLSSGTVDKTVVIGKMGYCTILTEAVWSRIFVVVWSWVVDIEC